MPPACKAIPDDITDGWDATLGHPPRPADEPKRHVQACVAMLNLPAAESAPAGHSRGRGRGRASRNRRGHRHESGRSGGPRRADQDANNSAAAPGTGGPGVAPSLQAPASVPTSLSRPPYQSASFTPANATHACPSPYQYRPLPPANAPLYQSFNPGTPSSSPYFTPPNTFSNPSFAYPSTFSSLYYTPAQTSSSGSLSPPAQRNRSSSYSSGPNHHRPKPQRSVPRCYSGSPAAEYFVVGRVFIRATSDPTGLVLDQEANIDPHYNMTTCGLFFTKNVYYVVVRVLRGGQRCLCSPINTYGGKGLAKETLNDEEAKDHTVIYSSGRSIPTEPRTDRQPIEVDMLNSREPLKQMSRLNFQKVLTVEFNQPTIEIGRVSQQSIPVLLKEYASVMTDQPANNVEPESATNVEAPLNVDGTNNVDTAQEPHSSTDFR